MADQFKSVTTTGFGSRIINSIKGVVTGLMLFIASFGVLYWNEGRVDLTDVAKLAVPASATEVSSGLEGKQVYVTAKVTSDEKIGDDLFLIPGDYLAVSRNVEMFAWVEHTSTSSDTNLGGSETTETTYSYLQQWTAAPQESSNFAQPEGHQNPVMGIQPAENHVSVAKVGVYDIDVANMSLPAFETIPLNEKTVKLTPGTGSDANGYIYSPADPNIDYNITAEPKLGDLRINYTVLKKDRDFTVFGKLEGSKISPYVDFENDNAQIYRMFAGSRDQAIATLQTEHNIFTWILRAVGFLMMWFGLGALFGPLSTLLDVVPFFGSLSRGIVGIVTFLISLVLSGATIFISMILHNVIALVVTVVAVVAIIVVVLKMKGKKGGGGGVAAPPVKA